MTTTVKVTAHNHPSTVTVTSSHSIKGPTNIRHTCTVAEYVLSDGQSQEFTVSNSQSVRVEEHPADQEMYYGLN
jgi:hypothetical protein